MKNRIFLFVTASFLLTACVSPTPISTPTLLPPSIAAETVTATPTSIPLLNLEGTLFFDYNGSGLRDDGEPPISNFEVCIEGKKLCVTTDENGRYRFEQLAPKGSPFHLSLIDPNANDPSLAFRYINIWLRFVNIPAYELNGVSIPEQRLNDTKTIEITNGFQSETGTFTETGLMQGFLIRPFCANPSTPEMIFNYFDIDSTTLWTSNGSQVNYLGDKTPSNPKKTSGTNDGHQGDDYFLPLGTMIFAPADGDVIRIDDENGINILISYLSDTYRTTQGHLDSRIVLNNGSLSPSILSVQKVYRGQIIALSSDTGDLYFGERTPQLHINLFQVMPGNPSGDPSIDIYRNVSGISYPSGSEISFWTKDNDPQNPYVCK